MESKKTYTVIPNIRFIDTAWNEEGKVTASRIECMPTRTFETLRQANAYIRECKAKGFRGVRVCDRTGLGKFF